MLVEFKNITSPSLNNFTFNVYISCSESVFLGILVAIDALRERQGGRKQEEDCFINRDFIVN